MRCYLVKRANYISPIRIGDLLRAYLFSNATGENSIRILGTIALEKTVGSGLCCCSFQLA